MMFTRPDGSLLVPERVARSFERLVKRSGLPRIRFHDLRHSHATHLIRAGAHVKVVAERLGHASASFTLDKYGHVLKGMCADAAAAVAALVDGRG
jgi:integrase